MSSISPDRRPLEFQSHSPTISSSPHSLLALPINYDRRKLCPKHSHMISDTHALAKSHRQQRQQQQQHRDSTLPFHPSHHPQSHKQSRHHPSSPSQVQTRVTSGKETHSVMKEEYGNVDLSSTELWTLPEFKLESGRVLKNVPCRYQTYGELNEKKSNVMVICHALTGHPVVAEWWSSLLGDNKAFDTSKYFIICANMLGSCYGTAGPTTINPETNKPYGPEFPYVTVRDSVILHCRLLQHLGVTHVATAIGGSIGGMQALEWGFIASDKSTYGFDVGSVIALACGASQSAWAIALNHIQRSAIYNDPLYANGWYDPKTPPLAGLAAARELAMCSYRTHHIYNEKFGRRVTGDKEAQELFAECYFCGGQPHYQIESYLQYQGTKFQNRFDANSYIRMSQQTDSHDVGRNRGGIEKALRSLHIPVLVVGIQSDVLYPVSDQYELQKHLPDCELFIIDSLEGHDAFLLEKDKMGQAITQFLTKYVVLEGEKQPPMGKPLKNGATTSQGVNYGSEKSKL